MGRLEVVLLITLVSLVSGCAQMEPWVKKVWPQKTDASQSVPSQGENEAATIVERNMLAYSDLTAEQYLSYFQELSTLTEVARKSQLEKTQQTYKKTNEIRHGILYALTLMAGPGEVRTSREALKVLDDLQNRILKTGKDTEQTALVHMLWKMVRTQVALLARSNRLSVEAGVQQERLVVLEEQIKALKNIEKSIYEREIGIASQD